MQRSSKLLLVEMYINIINIDRIDSSEIDAIYCFFAAGVYYYMSGVYKIKCKTAGF